MLCLVLLIPAQRSFCNYSIDLALVLDGSGSVTPQWGLVEQFAVEAIESFNVSSSAAHIAITEFSSGEPPAWVICPYPRPPAGCGLMDDKAALITMAKSMFNAGYGTAIGAGITVGQGALYSGALARPASQAAKVLLVLTDGNNNFPPDPVAAAQAARAAGTVIYVLGVGHKFNQTQLQAIASEPTSEHLYMADDFTGLLAALHNVTAHLCASWHCVDNSVCLQGPPGAHMVPLDVCRASCPRPHSLSHPLAEALPTPHAE